MNTYAIPLAALAVSLVTLLISRIDARRAANGKYVESIEVRLTRVEAELDSCLKMKERIEAQHSALLAENISLMRSLTRQDS